MTVTWNTPHTQRALRLILAALIDPTDGTPVRAVLQDMNPEHLAVEMLGLVQQLTNHAAAFAMLGYGETEAPGAVAAMLERAMTQ